MNLFSVRYFQQLLVARTISNVGNGISPVALAFGTLSIESSGPRELSLVLLARTVPIMVMLLIGGAFADRFGRAKIMAITDTTLGLLIVLIGFAFIQGQATIPLLVLVSLLSGVLNGFWYPAFTGLLPQIVPENQLQRANVIVSFFSNLAFMLGAALSGLSVTLLGYGATLIIDGITFFTAGLLLTFLVKTDSQRNREQAFSMIRDLKLGWGEFFSRKWLVLTIGASAVVHFGFEATYAVLGVLASKDFYSSETSWAAILTSLAAGMLLGSLVADRIAFRRRGVVALAALVLVPIFLIVLSAASQIWFVLFAALVAGIGYETYFVIWATTLQRNIPEAMLSRIMSFDGLAVFTFGPLGIGLAGVLALTFGLSNTLMGMALTGLFAIGLGLTFKTVRQNFN